MMGRFFVAWDTIFLPNIWFGRIRDNDFEEIGLAIIAVLKNNGG